MTNKKRPGSWIAGSLATLVAGYLSYASLSSPKPATPPSPTPVVQNDPRASNHDDTGRNRTLNNLISSIRQNIEKCVDYATLLTHF